MHHKLEHMKDILICAVEHEINNLENANCKELGEAIDMIKDLEEAIYYCTITEAMGKNGHEHYPIMNGNGHNYNVSPEEYDDKYCGNSYKNRKMYMEAKMMKKDKATQLRELEKYLQELSNDVIEMIQDSTLEEKQYVEKKITTLVTKIGAMK